MTDVLNPKLDEVLEMAGEPSAAYLNEADFREVDWQDVFYGPNYPRLLQIKKKYDPHSIFWARTAVGSEAWSESSGGKLCNVS